MRRFLHFIYCIFFLTTCVFPISAQNSYTFRHLDTSNGLPDNNVRNLIMLPNGLMCIQTSTMINLFDGASCLSYRYDPSCIPFQEYAGLSFLSFSPDNNLWISTNDHFWSFNTNIRKFNYLDNFIATDHSLSDEHIKAMRVDSNSNRWYLTNKGNLVLYNPATNKMSSFAAPPCIATSEAVVIACTPQAVWLLSIEGCLVKFDKAKSTFTFSSSNIPTLSLNTSSRIDMVASSKNDLYIMYDHNILLFDTRNNTFTPIHSMPDNAGDLFTTIAVDKSDNLWIGSSKSGVSIYYADSKSLVNLPRLNLFNGSSINHHTDISKIYVDNNDAVWIATLDEGLMYWHKDIFHLSSINNSNILGPNKMPDESSKCMTTTADGNILIGTIKGIVRYNPKDNTVDFPYPSLNDELCISIYRDKKNRIWLGTFRNGAYCIDGNNIRHYFYSSMPQVDISYRYSTPNLNCVRNFFEDDKGNFWVCVYGGLGKFDPVTGNITLIRDHHKDVSHIMLTRNVCQFGDLLYVASDNGYFAYSPSTDKVLFNLDASLKHIPCNQVITDSNGLLWLATASGIFIKDSSGKTYSLSSENGLPNNDIQGIIADNLGNVWASSFSYISRISVTKSPSGFSFSISTFNKSDGLDIGTTFPNSHAKTDNDVIFFGGSHGFCIIDPANLYQAVTNDSPIISSFSIFDKPVMVNEKFNGRTILDSVISNSSHIDLKYNETFITFGFSNLNYINPEHTCYRYMLKGFDKEWKEINSQASGKATYTFLEPGEYTFMVQAANNGTDWSKTPAMVSITVHPPFWKSYWAYTIYAILLLAAIAIASFYYLRMMHRKALRSNYERLRTQKEEMDQMKFRFFTNISHELRTPLSLILLPLDNILKKSPSDSPFRSQLLTIHRNATQLLSLVNHLLDFRKLEMHGERLSLSQGDFAEFVENIVTSFYDAAADKEIDISFINNVKNPFLAFDPSQMNKVVNNILSNALKYTPNSGHIIVSVDRQHNPDANGNIVDHIILSVKDSGIGIPKKDIPHIFERFYQSDTANKSDIPGTGIGLCLVKQYVDMHSGSIDVQSVVGKGSTFTVSIPCNLNAMSAIEKANVVSSPDDTLIQEQSGTIPYEKKTKILIIEDNAEFRKYISDCLSEFFDVAQAGDGEEGLDMISKINPDVIISDVMMPKIDGLEVCKRVKHDINISHIPIILLTARNSEDIRTESYESGADAYLTKPFNFDVLLARIRNLIDERRRKMHDFAINPNASPSEVTVSSIDEQLMTNIMADIEKNMSNPKYSVEDLSANVAMHRMTLYRKLQSITGMTPSEFMRTIRLKRAAQIICQDSGLSIQEVSEMVGFNTPKYFTKYFREMFGVTPSQYANDKKSENTDS